MLKELVIIGASGFGIEILELIKEINKKNRKWNILGFIDDDENLRNSRISSYPVLGSFRWIKKRKKNTDIVFAIGNRKIVSNMIKKIQNNNLFNYPNIIHPSVMCKHINMGFGIIIFKGAILSTNAILKNHIFIGFNSIIGHDVYISNYSFIASGVVLNGGVKISEGAYFGANSTCYPMLKIGKYSKVALGSAVMSDVKENKTVIGVPAKVIF